MSDAFNKSRSDRVPVIERDSLSSLSYCPYKTIRALESVENGIAIRKCWGTDYSDPLMSPYCQRN